MISHILISFLLMVGSGCSAWVLSDDLRAVLKPLRPDLHKAHAHMRTEITASPGWLQGIQYLGTECAGTSFVTTNIATGVCIRDGVNSSYIQYFYPLTGSEITLYEFSVATFSDGSCTALINDVPQGTMDPNFVCYLDTTGFESTSKTIYYYPGNTPPPYPYNGILTSYIGGTNCSGDVIKTVILNPDTCFTNYVYNASATSFKFQSYKTLCDADHPIQTLYFSDAACTVPAWNYTEYGAQACQPAVEYRLNNLPELYLINTTGQFDYESAAASCYMGPTVFFRTVYDFLWEWLDWFDLF